MKKLAILFVVLFLVACNGTEGESITKCVDGAIETIIEGYNDEIVRWIVRRTITRAEFDEEFSQDMYLTDDEIVDLFAQYSSIEGISAQVIELSSNELVVEIIYDYTVIPVAELSRMWGVDDFEDSITLSLAITGLEEENIVCEVSTTPEEEEGS